MYKNSYHFLLFREKIISFISKKLGQKNFCHIAQNEYIHFRVNSLDKWRFVGVLVTFKGKT